jgi:hypothetical protein
MGTRFSMISMSRTLPEDGATIGVQTTFHDQISLCSLCDAGSILCYSMRVIDMGVFQNWVGSILAGNGMFPSRMPFAVIVFFMYQKYHSHSRFTERESESQSVLPPSWTDSRFDFRLSVLRQPTLRVVTPRSARDFTTNNSDQ